MNFSALETHLPVGFCEQGIVSAHADVIAWEKFRAALPYDYRAGGNRLAGVQFYAAILRVAVSAVSRRALSFFMSHC
jgi:hypothetical protein